MNSVHDQIRTSILERAGVITPALKTNASLESLRESEWSMAFEGFMRNRLIMGALRYGGIKAPGKARYDRVDSIRQRLDMYRETGNAEHLVDIANLCLLEFEEPNHPDYHFTAQDGGHHTEEI